MQIRRAVEMSDSVYFNERRHRVPIDALAVLQRDHVRALLLVHKLGNVPVGSSERDALLLQLSRELAVHASVEEKVLYSELRDATATRVNVLAALKHHERIHALLFDLVATTPTESDWRNTFVQLAAEVARYVQYEEAELFPAVRQLMTPLRRRRMTRELLAEQRRLTRSGGSAAASGRG